MTDYPDRFRLDPGFVLDQIQNGPSPAFGFGEMGKFTFNRTYSRLLPDGSKETYRDVVLRMVEFVFNMQLRHAKENELAFDEEWAQEKARAMYKCFIQFKTTPSGRGLWAAGTAITEEAGLIAALCNCGFVSTKYDPSSGRSPSRPFTWSMDALMLGTGVGYDTEGADTIHIQHGVGRDAPIRYQVPDTRGGWVESFRMVLDHYMCNGPLYTFDYSLIRKAGTPLKTFGGIAPGPDPLIKLHKEVIAVLESRVGKLLGITACADICNMIGICVVSGNVRRSSEILLGPPGSKEFLDLKNPEVNAARNQSHGYASNNSVMCTLGMDYTEVAERVVRNGEPGVMWLENARTHGRMNGLEAHGADRNAGGCNPCGEQTLESYELCNLAELYMNNFNSLEEFLDAIEIAMIYTKTVTLGRTEWEETNEVMDRNRRTGIGPTGVAQFLATHSRETLCKWYDIGYAYARSIDKAISKRFSVPESIKITTVKPSGTVSLLGGATSGIHYPESRFIIRRIRVSKHKPFGALYAKAGYHVEDNVYDPTAEIISFPVDYGKGVVSVGDVSAREQLELAALHQEHWSDNQVSITVTFDKSEHDQIKGLLEHYQWRLKSGALFPKFEKSFPQMPLEAITEEEYHDHMEQIEPLDTDLTSSSTARHTDSRPELFCTSDSCVLVPSRSSGSESEDGVVSV